MCICTNMCVYSHIYIDAYIIMYLHLVTMDHPVWVFAARLAFRVSSAIFIAPWLEAEMRAADVPFNLTWLKFGR